MDATDIGEIVKQQLAEAIRDAERENRGLMHDGREVA